MLKDATMVRIILAEQDKSTKRDLIENHQQDKFSSFVILFDQHGKVVTGTGITVARAVSVDMLDYGIDGYTNHKPNGYFTNTSVTAFVDLEGQFWITEETSNRF